MIQSCYFARLISCFILIISSNADIYSSHLVDLDYEEDFVAEMVIPSCTEDSKLMSTPLHTTPAFEFDPLLVPLPDDAFFPSSSCANSSCGPSSSYMADPTTSFIDIEEKKVTTYRQKTQKHMFIFCFTLSRSYWHLLIC